MKPHAFIAMPFGTKPGADGQPIHFNRVFDELLGPALRDAGFDVVRADEEQRAGDIRTDMFQELLAADLVLADLTIDNPNVWYELGVRHALRSRGVILVQGPRPTQPFDIYTDRKFNYSLKDGAPDPATLAADRAAIADMARESHAASTRRKVSPVYALLPHLEPPQWQQLLMAGDNEFSAAYAVWKSRLEVARQKKRAGDILVLAGETPVRALATEAYLAAGRALLQLWQGGFALEQIDAALAFDPDCLPARQQRVVCLCRLHQFDEAREAAQALLRTHPRDAEALALAGRVEKEAWIERFRPPGAPPAAPGTLREAARGEDALLAEAIAPYLRGFVADPAHFYSGINALTLNVLRAHLEGEHDPALTDRLLAGLRWAIASALERAPKDYWARASLAELSLLCFGADAVRRDWKNAVAASNKDWFALDSSRQTLQLLSELGFRPEETALALAIVQAEIRPSEPALRAAPGAAVLRPHGRRAGAAEAALSAGDGAGGDRADRACARRTRRRARRPGADPGRGRRRPDLHRGLPGARRAGAVAAAAARARLPGSQRHRLGRRRRVAQALLRSQGGAAPGRAAAHDAGRDRAAAEGRRQVGTRQPVAAVHRAGPRPRQGALRLPVGRRRQRRPRRHEAHVRRGQAPHRPRQLDRHPHAVSADQRPPVTSITEPVV